MRNKCLRGLSILALLAASLVAPAGAASPEPSEDARAIVEALVACGTRHSLSSWTDTKRGIGCGRDVVVRRLEAVENESGKRMRVVVDKFETSAPRTKNVPVPMENIYAILPGTDPALERTAFVVSGHYDSMPSDILDPPTDAPGADDEAARTGGRAIGCGRLDRRRACARADEGARGARLRGGRGRGAGPPRWQAPPRMAHEKGVHRGGDDPLRHRGRHERESRPARARVLRRRSGRNRLSGPADGAPRGGDQRRGQSAPRLPARPLRARRGPPAVRRGGPPRGAIHGAA